MGELKLKVDLRTGVGKNKVDKIRRDEGLVPGVVYGHKEEPRNVKVDSLVFDKIYKEAGESTLIDLVLDGETVPVLIKEVQTHPFRNEYIHVDFQQLNMKETVRLTVPLVLVGRDNIDVDVKEATLMQQLDEIEIECLPGDIPQSIDVNVSDITLDEAIFVSDMDIFTDDRFTVLTEGEEPIASLIIPTEEVEADEDMEEVEADDVPVVGEEEETEE